MQFTPQLIAQGKQMLQPGQSGNSTDSEQHILCGSGKQCFCIGANFARHSWYLILFGQFSNYCDSFLLLAPYPSYATIPSSQSQTLVLPMGMLSGQSNLLSAANSQQGKPDMSKVSLVF